MSAAKVGLDLGVPFSHRKLLLRLLHSLKPACPPDTSPPLQHAWPEEPCR